MSNDFAEPSKPKKSALPIILGLGGLLFLLCAGGIVVLVVGLIFPALNKVKETEERLQIQSNLRQIGLASLNYESSMGDMVHNSHNRNSNKAMLSWRFQLFPYMEYDNLFNQADWLKPSAWDDPINKNVRLAAVKEFNIPGQGPSNQTYLQAFSGPSAILDPKSPRTDRLNGQPKALEISTIPDGASNTIFVIESGTPVTIIQPVDLNYPGGPIPPLGYETTTGRFALLFADGSARSATTKRLTDTILTKLVVIDDGIAKLKD